MAKTVFADGTVVTAAVMNALNNPIFVASPDNDGEIALIDDDDMSDGADQLKSTSYTYFNQLLVREGASGLQLAYNGGTVILGDDTAATIASGTINATDDATSFVHITEAGVVAVASELPIRCIPLARVVAGAGTISVIEDLRPRWQVLPRPEEIALNTDESVAILQAPIAQGRLTLSTGTPVPEDDVTAADTLHYTPYNGDAISLWNEAASRWDLYKFTELSLDISGLAANTNFDIFIYDNSGTLTLEAVAWTNSGAGTSSRASAISQRNGIWVKTSDNRRYLGTIRTTRTAGQCEFTDKTKFVWNVQNQVPQRLYLNNGQGTAYTYDSATWRETNNSTANRFSLVLGLPTIVSVTSIQNVNRGVGNTGTSDGMTAIGINSIVPDFLNSQLGFDGQSPSLGDTRGVIAFVNTVLNAGHHYFQQLENSDGGASSFFPYSADTFASGMQGEVAL